MPPTQQYGIQMDLWLDFQVDHVGLNMGHS
jgi:hypothetical protein